MANLNWTSKQYHEENTLEDIARLGFYFEEKAKVEELEAKKQKLASQSMRRSPHRR